MTLTKTKPKRATTEHLKRHGRHHRHSQHYIKTYWPYLPVVTILLAGLLANSWLVHLHRDVLGYATDMSAQTLLDDTNAQRTANNENALNINTQLTQAAQAKANDMAARNYWSHDTPDGKTPWTFILNAGYQYQTAGENLAYGFTTAGDTITGWMNSPEHRANILNTSYRDVGFGIVNIPSYQDNGPETLVVAMYGSSASPVVAVSSPPTQPVAASPAPATQPASTPAPAPAPSKAPSPIATAVPATSEQPAATPSSNTDTIEPSQVRVSRLQLVSSNTPMNTLVITIICIAACVFLILHHSLAWRRAIIMSEAFVIHHPLADIVAGSIISVGFVMIHTAGIIR